MGNFQPWLKSHITPSFNPIILHITGLHEKNLGAVIFKTYELTALSI